MSDSPVHDAIQSTCEDGELLVSWVVIATWATKDGRMLTIKAQNDLPPWDVRGLIHAGLHGAK